MSTDLTILANRRNLQSIDDLEEYLKSLCDHMGFIRSCDLNITNPEFLHFEDALELLKWQFIQRGFYGNVNR
jgi:hypothetical protein